MSLGYYTACISLQSPVASVSNVLCCLSHAPCVRHMVMTSASPCAYHYRYVGDDGPSYSE